MREAILAVSFGSTVDQARSRDLEGVEQALSAAAPELPLFRASPAVWSGRGWGTGGSRSRMWPVPWSRWRRRG